MNYISRFKLTNANITLLLAIFFAVVLNIPVYSDLYKILSKLDAFSIGFVISIPIFFTLALNILFNVISWPYITKPLFVILVLMSSLLSYAEFNYGIMFDKTMIRNLFETNSSEASSYFSGFLFFWILISGVLPAVALSMITIKSESVIRFLLKKVIYIVVSGGVIFLIAHFFYQDYASVVRNNKFLEKRIVPTAFLHNTYRYLRDEYWSDPIPYTKLGMDAHQTPQSLAQATQKPTVLIFVVGETARAQNYPFNGYDRETTPYTQSLKNMINFRDVASCGTSTAISVPCMFSRMNREHFNRDHADQQDNALDILNRANVDVLWRENDGGDKHVAHAIKEQIIDASQDSPLCDGHTCQDMALIENLKQQINAMHGNRVVVLHFIGSHGPTYFQRYPKTMAYFAPNCDRADIENCTVQQIINTYDNTIRYTDYVLKQTIDTLQSLEEQYNVALIYISDHGESLGENGMFLHGTPYQFAPIEQRRVPLMIWLSNGLMAQKHIQLDCLKQEAHHSGWSQDNIFDSILGLMDVQTSVYRPQQDIFASCRKS
ncbi:phosphoethanolamine transferase [Celerinatantimonas sp. YJH-8]|uniref:phosphoethanolamine transferase n=1 Tax=Celerinatantimonas sp. YJH-8 TaxID=3228714 RepID=UPI0038C7CF6E